MDFSSQRIVIIDYGMGNVGSINNMLKYLGARAVISADHEVIQTADKLIMPGVGHFDSAMGNINKKLLVELLNEMALVKKVPFLGICLGMQLMCNSSEEGSAAGLGFVNAAAKKFRFPDNNELKIPHMGWNYINPCKKSNLLMGLEEKSRFYFVHSYFVECIKVADRLTTTQYGHDFVSAFEHDNLIGVQFHPEKSHRFGITLFKNFLSSY